MNKKILVVDYNKLNVMLLEQILEDENYEVSTLPSGKEVLEKCQTLKPDAVLLDIMMPDIDGFEVCRMLKENPDTRHIPIIMVTAKAEGMDLKRAFDLGAFDYIKKPIDEIEVIARLNSALRYRSQEKRLEELAMRDGLTGLYNHKLIIELFNKECDRLKKTRDGIAFVMLDIDHFKNVNDTFGHTAGDEVLRGLSEILTSHVRENDIIGRYGGEEFCIVLLGVTEKSVLETCEDLREAVEKHIFKTDEGEIKITISIGTCFKLSDEVCECEDMIVLADKALYKAKNLGRNRVETSVIK